MQGRRSTIESFPEAYEFDQGSSSSNSSLDPQIYWNRMLNPVDSRNITEYLLSPSGSNVPFGPAVNCESGSISGWNFGNPGPSGDAINNSHHVETKRELEWTSSLAGDSGAHQRVHEVRFGAGNMLSLENVDINLDNNNQQGFDAPQNAEHSIEFVNNRSHVSEACAHHVLNASGSDVGQTHSGIGSKGSCGTSSGNTSCLPEDGNCRPGGPLDSQRVSGKRKCIEGFPGQSSINGGLSLLPQSDNNLQAVSAQNNLGSFLNISSSSCNISGTDAVEGPNSGHGHGAAVEGATSGSHSFADMAGNTEYSHRNFRMRINPAQQHEISPPYLWSPGNSIRHPNAWLPPQPSYLPIPYNQLPEARPTVAGQSSQSQVPFIPSLPRNSPNFPWSGTLSLRPSRGDSSSSSPGISGDRLAPVSEGTHPRSIRRGITEPSIFISATDMRHLEQDPTNWSLSGGNISSLGHVASTSRAGSNLGSHSSASPTRVSRQSPSVQYPVRLSEFVRRSFPSAGSDPGGQSSNGQPQHLDHSTSSQDVVDPGNVIRVRQQPHLRASLFTDRQNDGVLGVPLSVRMAAMREGRSRMIRNALDFIRRGENLRFEDVLILDQSIFGGVNLHDRHRDMRLDVDNMSYEELLALEERIGNVSTGLPEETVLKHLKQRKCLAITSEASEEVEPCCICQEEYVEGEDLGTLDCGHDFHGACIKQWLAHKNLCPICKTTGLVI